MTPRETAELLNVPLRTLQYWRDTKQGPAYLRISPKIIRYRREDVSAFLEQSTK